MLFCVQAKNAKCFFFIPIPTMGILNGRVKTETVIAFYNEIVVLVLAFVMTTFLIISYNFTLV